MLPVAITSSRLDQMDAENFRTMVESPSFDLFMARLKAELERSREVCEFNEDPVIFYRGQGAVAALRMALGLPTAILKEIERKRR